MIEQVKVTYYPSAKAFEKQTKTTEEQKTKQNITKKKTSWSFRSRKKNQKLKSMEGLFPKEW